MSDGLMLTLNGRERAVDGVVSPAMLSEVLAALALRADRIAAELNGELVPRTGWAEQRVVSGDKLEVVHFVGGGAGLSSQVSRLGELLQESFPAVAVGGPAA